MKAPVIIATRPRTPNHRRVPYRETVLELRADDRREQLTGVSVGEPEREVGRGRERSSS